jgi:hypothetical protein
VSAFAKVSLLGLQNDSRVLESEAPHSRRRGYIAWIRKLRVYCHRLRQISGQTWNARKRWLVAVASISAGRVAIDRPTLS